MRTLKFGRSTLLSIAFSLTTALPLTPFTASASTVITAGQRECENDLDKDLNESGKCIDKVSTIDCCDLAPDMDNHFAVDELSGVNSVAAQQDAANDSSVSTAKSSVSRSKSVRSGKVTLCCKWGYSRYAQPPMVMQMPLPAARPAARPAPQPAYARATPRPQPAARPAPQPAYALPAAPVAASYPYAMQPVIAAPMPAMYAAPAGYNPYAAYPAPAPAQAGAPVTVTYVQGPQSQPVPQQAPQPVPNQTVAFSPVAPVAPPAPPAAPIAPPVATIAHPAPPVSAAPVGDVVLSNLAQAPINYSVNGTPYEMETGYNQKLTNRNSWTIEFDRGDGASVARYTLAPGAYHFVLTEKGWDLNKVEESSAAPAPPTRIPGFENIARNR